MEAGDAESVLGKQKSAVLIDGNGLPYGIPPDPGCRRDRRRHCRRCRIPAGVDYGFRWCSTWPDTDTLLKIISTQDFRPDRCLIRYSDKTAKQMVSGTMLLPGIWSSGPCSTPHEPEFRQETWLILRWASLVHPQKRSFEGMDSRFEGFSG